VGGLKNGSCIRVRNAWQVVGDPEPFRPFFLYGFDIHCMCVCVYNLWVCQWGRRGAEGAQVDGLRNCNQPIAQLTQPSLLGTAMWHDVLCGLC
jgi:hypothetical protein